MYVLLNDLPCLLTVTLYVTKVREQCSDCLPFLYPLVTDY